MRGLEGLDFWRGSTAVRRAGAKGTARVGVCGTLATESTASQSPTVDRAAKFVRPKPRHQVGHLRWSAATRLGATGPASARSRSALLHARSVPSFADSGRRAIVARQMVGEPSPKPQAHYAA